MVLVNCFQILWPYAAITALMQLVLIAQVSGTLLEGWNTSLPKDIPLLCFDDAGGERCPPGRSEVSYEFHWVEIWWLRNATLLPALLLHRKDIHFTTAVHRPTTYWFYFWKKQDNGWEVMQSTYGWTPTTATTCSMHSTPAIFNLMRDQREPGSSSIYMCMNRSKDGYQSVSDTCQLAWNFHEMLDTIFLRERAERICEAWNSTVRQKPEVFHCESSKMIFHPFGRDRHHVIYIPTLDAYCISSEEAEETHMKLPAGCYRVWVGYGNHRKPRIVEVASEGSDSQSTCIYRVTVKLCVQHTVSLQQDTR